MLSKGHELAEMAAGQWGLVTTAQARGIGITAQNMSQMAKSGDLIRLAHGIYRLAGNPIDRHEDLRVAWLGLDPGKAAADRIAEQDVDMVSHRSAALVLELGDLEADVMEFTVPQRRQTRRMDVRLHRAATSGEWALVDGLPVATPLRIIGDLAEAGIDRGHLATIVRDAMIKNDLPADAVAVRLSRYARRYGGTTGNGSGLLTVLLREAGIPRSTLDVATRGIPKVAIAENLHTSKQQALDPSVLRAIMPRLDPSVLNAIMPKLDSSVLNAIMPRLDPAVLRAIMPKLDPAVLRAIMPRLDPIVLNAIMPKLDPEVWRAFQRETGRAWMPAAAKAIQDLPAVTQREGVAQTSAGPIAEAKRQGAVDEDEQRKSAAIESQTSGDSNVRRGGRG